MSPTWPELLRTFGRIGLLSFGGPAAQIALMHTELVERRRWLDEDGFLRGLGFCTLLPGPEAMQLATYAGWRLRGAPGGVAAGLLFVLPGAALMMTLAALYLAYGRLPLVEAAFLGVKAATLAIVAGALWKLRAKALRGPLALGVAGAAFLGLFMLDLPFWAVLGAALALGLARPAPGTAPSAPVATVATGGTSKTIAMWLAIWWLPLLTLIALAPGSVPAEAGLFFSWLATVSFGGAYAVLAALAQNAVEVHGWLAPEQMIDGLGLAETTPGPLILVTVFTGWLGGAQVGLAFVTALVTLWATFAPCFLWIFAGAPHLERLTAHPRLRGALDMVSAAVAGVIANLSLWFAIHVLFRDVAEGAGPPRPAWSSLDPGAAALAAFAVLWLLVLKRSLLETLFLSAVLGVSAALLGG